MTRPGKPRYVEIAESLAAEIAAGALPVGQSLPSETALCARFRVSRHTVREALRMLGQMGLIDRRQGSGTRIRATHAPDRFNPVVHTLDDLWHYGDATRLVIAEAQRAPLSEEFARRLRKPAGTHALLLSGMRYTRDPELPLCTTQLAILPGRGVDEAALLDPARAPRALVELFALRKLSHVEQTLSAATLSAPEAKLLQAKPRSAALVAWRRVYTADGRLLALTVSTHPAERFTYSHVLTRARHGAG
jgi:DNA-binding GntR family transcriptional regulator